LEQVTNDIQKAQVIAEYTALRSEIEKRIVLRQQVLLAVLLLAGTFFVLGVQDSELGISVLCYPVIALFLAAAWRHESMRICHIRNYILTEIEMRYNFRGWETHRQTARNTMHQKGHWDQNEEFMGLGVSARCIFVATQIFALVIGIVRSLSFFHSLSTLLLIILLVLANVAATITTYHFTKHYREK